MYVYKKTEQNPDLFTVGFYDPNGKWEPDTDWSNRAHAAQQVSYLNGGATQPPELSLNEEWEKLKDDKN
jgi:hypothetical protein